MRSISSHIPPSVGEKYVARLEPRRQHELNRRRVDLLDIELPDGRKAKREVIRHGNAVAILAAWACYNIAK